MINVERKRQHIVVDDSCPLCAVDVETTLHAIRDCTFTRNIWRSMIPNQVCNTFCNLSSHVWLMWNVQDKGNLTKISMKWQTFCHFMLAHLEGQE